MEYHDKISSRNRDIKLKYSVDRQFVYDLMDYFFWEESKFN